MATSAESVRRTHIHCVCEASARVRDPTLQPVCAKCWFSFAAECEQGQREKVAARWNTKVLQKHRFQPHCAA